MRQDLVLIPGLLLDRRLWAAQTADLADLAEAWIPDISTHDDMAALAASLLEELPPRFALAGLSMGGYVALEILRQAPERITRLALLDTSAYPDTPTQVRRRRAMIALSGRGAFQGVTRKLLPQLLHAENLKDEALVSLVMDMAKGIGREGFQRQQRAILSRAAYAPLLPQINVPALVLCGEADQLTPPAQHRQMAIAIQTARLEMIKGAGHLPPLERPADTTAALRRWLLREV
ncbi:MAG: alpha/beta fold hydrolase [Pseudomonadota bacterium]